jgi:hypothetical protein
MATISERLAYVLTFDTSSGVKSLNKLGSTADKELGKAEKKLDKMSAGLTKFGAGAVAFAGLAGAGLVKVAMGASDLEESINAVRVTFGEAGEGILQLGRDAAKAVGLSNVEFNSLAVQFSSFAEKVAGEGGNVVQTMADMTGRAADFASVMNIDVAEAARVFQSGLAGETEPLKKLGLDLSAAAVGAFAVANGISVSASAMSESDKVQARYGLLMEQTAKHAGDFANTSEGLANQQRTLKAEFKNLSDGIGAGVLPMLTELVGVAGKAVGAFSQLSPEMQGTIGKFGALGVAGVGLIGTMSFLAGQAIKMRDRFTTLGDDGSRSITKLGKAVGAASLAFAAFAAAETTFQIFNTISDNSGKAKRGLEGIAIAAGAVADGTGTATAMLDEFNTLVTVMDHEQKASHLWEDFGKKIKVAGTESKRNIEDIDRAFDKTLATSAAAAQVLLDSWSLQADALDHSSDQYKDNIELIERYQERVDSQVGAQDALTGLLNDSTGAQDALTGSVEAGTDAMGLFNDEGELLPEILAQQEDAIERVTDKHTASVDAINEAYDLVKDAYDESVREAEQWADGLNSAAEAGGDGFGTFQSTATTDLKKWATALNESTVAEAQWKDNLVAVYKRAEESVKGSGDAIVTSLAGMGTDGAEETQALLDATDEDFGNMASAMAISTAVGQRDVAAELGKLPGHMTLAMQMAEIERSRAMMEANLAARTEARELGNLISSGIGLGISSGAYKIDNAIRDAVEGAITAAKTFAEIESPSRLFAEEVGQPIAQGVAEGVNEEAYKIADALTKSIEDAEESAITAAEKLSDEVIGRFKDLANDAEDVLGGLFGEINAADKIEGLGESVSDAEQSLADAQQKLADVRADEASTREEIARAIEAESDAQESLRDANMVLTEATIANTVGTDGQRDAWITSATAAGLTVEQILNLEAAYKAALKAQEDLAAATVAEDARLAAARTSIAAEADAANQLNDRFREAAGAGFVMDSDFEALGKLAGSPKQQLALQQSILDRIAKFFANPPAPPPKRTGGGGGGRVADPMFFASGTNNAPGGPAFINERGAELVTLPGGAKVATAAASKDLMSGVAAGTTAFNITVNAGMGTDGAAVGNKVIETIKAYERRNGAGWRS